MMQSMGLQRVRHDLATQRQLQIVIVGFPGGSVVNNPPEMQEMRAWSLGQEDVLEKEMANHSSILAWEIPWTEESDRLKAYGVTKESDST